MHSLHELEAMAPAETIAIAESMGMKKANSADIQDVIYYILDNQASNTAKEEASKVAARHSEGKKRGRKKKTAATPEPTPSAETVNTPDKEEESAEQPVKKKRGRKSKAQLLLEQQEAELKAQESPDTPKEENVAVQEEQAKKKRGRKPKTVKEPETAETTQTEDLTNVLKQPEVKALPAPKKEEIQSIQPTEKNVEKRKNPNATFDSFFGKTKGRTFTPRGQQPVMADDQQSSPQAVPPVTPQPKPQHDHKPHIFNDRSQQILIQEPGANSQTPKNQQKNKRQRQQFGRQQELDSRFPASALEGKLTVYGVLEIMPEGFGFLRSSDFNYLPSPDDIYISQQQIKQYGLRMGDVVEASVRLPLPEEKYYPMVQPISINGLEPSGIRDRAKFEHLTPLFPEEKFEITKGNSANISTRIVDMFAPIGKGQRALIVAPPKTGKTILLKDIANAISENHPETYIIMLLIDERPEEVTDMARSVNAEVIASTFDEPADRHVRIAGIVLEKAKRLVESGHDVVIMLDSITRLARAYNTVSPASGKILSGGVDANALQRPKRFFGAARNIEGGGSLTIIATALTETSSKMDEVIFEEFKGTGNMELQLDRKLSNKRIFPAVDIVASSTRRDDLLLPDETLNRMWILRNYLGDMNSLEAMEFMKKRMEMTRSNEELLVTMDQ